MDLFAWESWEQTKLLKAQKKDLECLDTMTAEFNKLQSELAAAREENERLKSELIGLQKFKDALSESSSRYAEYLIKTEDHLAALRAFAMDAVLAFSAYSWMRTITEKHGLIKDGQKTERLTG